MHVVHNVRSPVPPKSIYYAMHTEGDSLCQKLKKKTRRIDLDSSIILHFISTFLYFPVVYIPAEAHPTVPEPTPTLAVHAQAHPSVHPSP